MTNLPHDAFLNDSNGKYAEITELLEGSGKSKCGTTEDKKPMCVLFSSIQCVK